MGRSRSRGFTLVELMIAVAIIGILASIAVPEFSRASLRARKAERDLVLDAVARAVEGVLVHQGTFPAATFTGDWNPAGAPGPSKRPFDFGAVGWKELDLVLEGGLYFQYKFVGVQVGATPQTVDVFAQSDLDGDGVLSQRAVSYDVSNGDMRRTADVYAPDPNDTAF